MAYYSETLQKGSQGEETKKWQTFLKSQGYDLNVDGIFGDVTDKYTREYQAANGLGVDGIVGKNTWGKAGFTDISTPVSAPTMKPATSAPTLNTTPTAKPTLNTTPTAKPTLSPTPTAPTYDSTSWDDTEKGGAALGAYDTAKDAVLNYGDFTYGNQDQLNAIMDKILNREKFTYDLNGDALYQQYKDKYVQQGKMAMGDAIGQASAMTGGYGNSYAQSVGQQAYQAQLENLNDIVPELYQMAYDKYNQEGQDLYNQYGMLSDDYTREQGAWNDKYGKLMDALGIAKSDYYDGADMFYTEQNNKNTIAGREFDDAMSIWNAENENAWRGAEWDESNRRYENEEAWRNAEWDESNRRYENENAWKQAEWDESLRQHDNENAWNQAEWDESNRRFEIEEGWREKEYNAVYGNKTTGNDYVSSNKGVTPSGASYDNGSLTTKQVKELQEAIGADADGYYGDNSKKAAGGLSADEAYKKYVGYKVETKSDFTGTTYSSAVEYMTSKGVPQANASGMMTASEWQRRKSSYQTYGTGGTEVKNYSSYQAYIQDYVAYAVETYGK